MKRILILITIILFTISGYGQDKKQPKTDRYVDSAIYYFNKSKTAKGIDSLVFVKGIKMMDSIPVDDNSIGRIENAAEEFKKMKKSDYYTAIESAHLILFDNAHEYYKEINFGKEIINRYDANQNPEDRILFLIILQYLRIPFRLSDKLTEGFDFYTSKLKLYLQRNDSAAISICYYVHGGFYHTIGLNDLSIYYYKKSLPYLNLNDTGNNGTLGGLAGWRNNTSVLGDMYNTTGDYGNAILYSRAALKYGAHNKSDSTNLSYINKNIAYSKIMLNETDSVIDLLDEAIKIAKSQNLIEDLANCYSVKGIYYLKMNRLDSSEYYLQECENLIIKSGIPANSTGGFIIPNYYLALVKVKQNRFKDAEALIKTELPRLVNMRADVLKEYKLLVEVYLDMGDVKNATETFRKHNALQEELQTDERKNRSMSFETEQKITEAEGTINNLNNEKHVASITRNYLIGGLIVVLMFSIVFFRQRNNIKAGKKKSDDLLLNILPEEVAEELKHNGKSDARNFAEATVMFTDFKDFTKISEGMNPSELVKEIDFCFSAFDNIIHKHGIEKIKTIGDAYMCAGGLPVANKTHAEDTVKAALEIRDYMANHNKEKLAKRELPFEIRIGINTGPVVAGIVGVKKFAYDIWGDTVNLASRMESSGKEGEVNISGSTYELIKDKFTCTHRGKIQTKNKGEVDMYFVS